MIQRFSGYELAHAVVILGENVHKTGMCICVRVLKCRSTYATGREQGKRGIQTSSYQSHWQRREPQPGSVFLH